MFSHCLRYVMNGCIVMTYGPCQRCPESRASQSSSHAFARLRSTTRGGRAAGAGLFHLSPAGVSLPPASTTVEGAAAGQRTQTGVYGETAYQFDSTGAVVRICQEPVHRRCRQSCLAGSCHEGEGVSLSVCHSLCCGRFFWPVPALTELTFFLITGMPERSPGLRCTLV